MNQYEITISTADEGVARWIMAYFVEGGRSLQSKLDAGPVSAHTTAEAWKEYEREYSEARDALYAAYDAMEKQINEAAEGED